MSERPKKVPASSESNKRQAILTAAGEVFREKDFHLATVEEIAKRAGVGKGTIYQYFDSKQDILKQLQLSYADSYIERLDHVAEIDQSFAEAIEMLVAMHLDNVGEIVELVGKASRWKDNMTDPEENMASAEEFIRLFRSKVAIIWERALANGEVREISFDMVMVVIIGMLIGVTGQTIHNNANHSMEDMKKEITDILLNGFRK